MTALLLAALLAPAQAEEAVTPAPVASDDSLVLPLSRCVIYRAPIATQEVGVVTQLYNRELERLAGPPALADKLSQLPGVRLDADGAVAIRDMRPDETAVILDGVWLSGATLSSARATGVGVTPIEHRPFGR